MPGLRGQQTESRNRDAVARRNSQNLARKVSFISSSEVIALTPQGKLTITLATSGGLTDTGAELAILLDGNELVLSSDGLTISQRHEFRRQAELQVKKQESQAYTAALHAEAQAIAFFQGQM